MERYSDKEHTSFPQWEDIDKYLSGTLPKDKAKDIETLLNENELFRDAFDGYKWIDKPKDVQRRINSIKKRTRVKIAQISPNIPLQSKRKSRVIPKLDMGQYVSLLMAMIIIGLILLFLYQLL